MITIRVKLSPRWNDYSSKDETENFSVEDFILKEVINKDRYGRTTEETRLENQPSEILLVLARMLERLLDSKIISVEEFHEIVGTYNREACEVVYEN